MKVRFLSCLLAAVLGGAAMPASAALAPQDAAKAQGATNAPAQKPEADAAPTDTKALQEAAKIADVDKKIAALEQILKDFPETTLAGQIDTQILNALIKKAGDATKAVQERAKAIAATDRGTGRSPLASLATALLNADLLLDDAEHYARKAVDDLKDKDAFIAGEKQALARRQEEARKRNPGATAPEPPTDAALASTYDTQRQTATLTLGQINEKRGRTAVAEQAYREVYAISSRGPSGATAASKLAEAAGKAGRTAEQIEYLTVLALNGRIKADELATLNRLYAAAPAGSAQSLDEMLDARYRKENPLPVHAKPYVRTKDRTSRIVLAEVFTGAGCPPCAGADLAYDVAMERYSHRELAVLMYHQHIPRPDPMSNLLSQKRAEYYAVPGVPTVALDGVSRVGGGNANEAAEIYAREVEPRIEGRLVTKAGARLGLSASLKDGVVTAIVDVRNLVASARKPRLHIVLAEKLVRYSGENGIRFHPMVVRSMLAGPDGQGVALAPGRGFTTRHTFDVQKAVDEAKAHLDDFEQTSKRFGKFQFVSKKHEIDRSGLYVVAFVQDDESKEILQSALASLVPAQTAKTH